jgi:hypothetical protein
MTTELIDDAPKPPEKRYSQKYPGLVQLSWEESEKLVRDAESGRNPARVVYATGDQTALQRRVASIGTYRQPRSPGWIHTIPPHKPRRGADWGIVLALSVMFGFALLVLIVLASV